MKTTILFELMFEFLKLKRPFDPKSYEGRHDPIADKANVDLIKSLLFMIIEIRAI